MGVCSQGINLTSSLPRIRSERRYPSFTVCLQDVDSASLLLLFLTYLGLQMEGGGGRVVRVCAPHPSEIEYADIFVKKKITTTK